MISLKKTNKQKPPSTHNKVNMILICQTSPRYDRCIKDWQIVALQMFWNYNFLQAPGSKGKARDDVSSKTIITGSQFQQYFSLLDALGDVGQHCGQPVKSRYNLLASPDTVAWPREF